MKKIICFLLFAATLYSCSDAHKNLKDGLYAEIKTNKGTILLQLETEKAPITVANFVSLAEGTNPYVTNETLKKKPFYDGLLFHRVIADFMIQGGDPDGNGSGGAGYNFKDEFCSDLKFDKGGILAMANSGPTTNSSQFFITHVATPWLDGKHTIFGNVIENGMEVVNKIQQNDKIETIKIIRKGEDAKKFDAIKIFSDYFSHKEENDKKQALIDAENQRINAEKYKQVETEKAAELIALKATATKLPSGLLMKLVTKGTGKKPANGQNVFVHYAGFLENGKLFDSSIETVAQKFGKFDQNRADAHQYTPLPCVAGNYQFIPGFNEGVSKMNFGDKAILFIPSNLGYGEAGAGDAIPPNANIIFEVELLEK
jgi:cyclophilin family peptidyl-prolyl cis-trans isomerase